MYGISGRENNVGQRQLRSPSKKSDTYASFVFVEHMRIRKVLMPTCDQHS